MRNIGVDLHKNSFTVCFLEDNTKKKKTYKLEELTEFKRELQKTDTIGVESTNNTRYFVEEIRGVVKEVVIINPTQFKIISQSVKKTDGEDAEKIAIYLSKNMLPEVRMKDKQYSQINSMANTRDKLVKLRTILKNKIHNILSANGIISKKEDFTSQKGLNKVLEYDLDETSKIELEIIIEQIQHLKRRDKEVRRRDDPTRRKVKGIQKHHEYKGNRKERRDDTAECNRRH